MSSTLKRTGKRGRLIWFLRALRAREAGEGATPHPDSALERLTSARRPLLFSRMPRMLRDNGRTADSVQAGFRYIEDIDDEIKPATIVSPRRWHRALATSRLIASRRRRTSDGKPGPQ